MYLSERVLQVISLNEMGDELLEHRGRQVDAFAKQLFGRQRFDIDWSVRLLQAHIHICMDVLVDKVLLMRLHPNLLIIMYIQTICQRISESMLLTPEETHTLVAPVAQLGERKTEDLKVAGSSPAGGIF